MSMPRESESRWVRRFDSISATDVATVGDKNASHGEMISRLKESGIRDSTGFATTAAAVSNACARGTEQTRTDPKC